jgi:hypothetical protein
MIPQGMPAKFMLGMLTKKCFFQCLYLVIRDAFKHGRGRHFQSCAARQSTTAWNVGTDYRFQWRDIVQPLDTKPAITPSI